MMKKNVRVLWLLNHTTLRRFEVSQFRALGITEIFCPKNFPYDEGNLSASVDETLDATLSIPPDDLQVLNRQDWYDTPDEDAWRIANQYFDVAVIGFFPKQIASCVRYFQGAIVMRVFGLAKGHSYTQILSDELGATYIEKLSRLERRFWFGAGYEHLKEEEGSLFRKRNCFLPVGLEGEVKTESWRGSERRIFFVCPRIETSPYYQAIYRAFKNAFSDIGHVIGGAQPIRVRDASVIGYVPREIHERNMREMRVMFYHGTDPNHIHYHPFEAIRAGMPLVYMAGGMLDLLGGSKLPGRSKTVSEARRKIERILNDDGRLIADIRDSQLCLLEPMKPANCAEAWRAGYQRILGSLQKDSRAVMTVTPRKSRIAVIVPVGYRGGSLRGAKLLARAIETGSRQAGQEVEVVLGHLDDAACYREGAFADLPPSIKLRPYKWRVIGRAEAQRAMSYAGLQRSLDSLHYQVPDDGIRQFMDCDLWVIVSDRLEHTLLPVRPYALMVYDYLQRYENLLPQALNQRFLNAAHAAQRVFVSTEFTRKDAIQFAGLPERRIIKVPMLAPSFSAPAASRDAEERGSGTTQRYFLWTTNLAPHKNHENAFRALRAYYEEHDAQLECRVTGVDTSTLLNSDLPRLEALREIITASTALKSQVKVLGELPDNIYQAQLAGSEFLWHAGRVDNGTFAVVESACLGVPSLSSDYPAMREIDAQFSLNMAWMDPHDPAHMARQIKRMETESAARRGALPSAERMASQSLERLAGAYWKAVRECM
jgi:glycosyltransferase involved in cell wall biosynthesis